MSKDTIFSRLNTNHSGLKFMKLLLFIFLLAFPFFVQAQRITPEQYIETYKDVAIREMKEHKIPASITLAQGLLETGSGNSALAREAKNHFGIKCHKGWTGDTYYMDDDELNECFRKYDNVDDSFRDHSLFLSTRSRYAALFELDITDYEGWAKGLKAAGYATNPKYAQLLIDRINLYDLSKYDKIALGLIDEEQQPEPVIAVVEQEEELEIMELAFSPQNRGVFDLVDMTPAGRFIYENNGVRFVFAKEGEIPDLMAAEFGISAKKFYAYNCLSKPQEMVFHSGDVVYLAPLKNKNRHEKTYTVSSSETLRDVALRFGVKLEKLQTINKIDTRGYLEIGTVVKLK